MRQTPRSEKVMHKKASSMKSAQQKTTDEYSLIALHYGFSIIETPHITKEDIQKWNGFKDPLINPEYERNKIPFSFDIAEKASLLRSYVENRWDSLPHPLAYCFRKPFPGSDWRKPNDIILGLEIFGFTGSTAEALILRTALSILEDAGYKDLEISWNSIGDKESISDYERMLGNYIRKNIQLMPAELRKEVKESIFAIQRSEEKAFEKWIKEVPKSMSFLSEASRNHVKEVLEYIESFDVPYSIDPALIGRPEFTTHITFEIKSGQDVLAHSYRYSKLSKKLGFKRELPSIGATICLKKKDKEVIQKNIPKPRFYLVQLGFGAKIQTLRTLEVLRKAKIPVAHALMKDKMQSQMTSAENMKIPYMLLVGQKEAIEKSVVVRDVNTRVQETVSLTDLPAYLKKLP